MRFGLRRTDLIAYLCLLVGLVFLATHSAVAEGLPFELIDDGPKLPEFTFELLAEDGSKRELGFVELRGKPVVAVSWATWCSICAAELPRLARLQAQLGDELRVVALSIDDQGIDYASRTLRKRDIALRPYHDTEKMFFISVGARGVPTSVIADRDGRIVARASGPVPWDDPGVQRFLTALTEPTPVAVQTTTSDIISYEAP